MPHALVEIAIVAVFALLSGLLLQKLRQPAIVGYILAGVILGPAGLGLIEDRESVEILAELGVLLLLFTIGMELSLRGFRRVYRIALLGSGLQILLSIGVMLLLARVFGWETRVAVLFGFVVALSSTAVAIKMLEEIGELRTDVGRTAVGVLIAQDLAIVPMLLIINGMASGGSLNIIDVMKMISAVGLLVAMIAYLTRRERVALPFSGAMAGNVELTAITALAYCFGAAVLSSILGLSPAFGAFLVGLWIGNSRARTAVLESALPIQSVLLMVFFVSIGLLLDWSYVRENWAEMLVLLLMVTLLKTMMNVGILRLLGEPWPRAWLAGVVIGQIGEFSFVLVGVGLAAGLLGPVEHKMTVSIIALSLASSPLWMVTARRMQALPWRRIRSFRQFYNQLYGRETMAVRGASSRALVGTFRYTLQLGDRGLELFKGRHRAASSGESEAAEAAMDSDDAAFPETGAPQAGGPVPALALAGLSSEERAGLSGEEGYGAAGEWQHAPPGERPRDADGT